MSEPVSKTEEWLTSECNRILARVAALPQSKRKLFIDSEIESLAVSEGFRFALQNMLSVVELNTMQTSERWERITAVCFGVSFVLIMLGIALFCPHPTNFQYLVFRVVLALAAAGVGGSLSGFIHLDISANGKTWIRAGGALAVFVLVYLVNPAHLAVAGS